MRNIRFLVIALCLTFLGVIPLSLKAFGDTSVSTVTATPTNIPSDTATWTPTVTPIPAFTVSGTVTYKGVGEHNLFVFMTDNSGGFYLSSPLLNNGNFFFTASPNNIQGFVLWACYDFSGNGIELTPNWNGYGLPVQQGNGEALTNSGDVICNVGYYGDCMSIGPGGGTHYTSNASVTIIFGGKTGLQSGTICTE
jgi:hypothetical protein